MMKLMTSSKGLFGLAFVGILFKLNVLENFVETCERLSN
jgi:hypothetical protein